MQNKQFWQILVVVTLATALISAALHALPKLLPHWPLSLLAIFIFTVLSILIYFLGKRAATATNKHLFTNVVMGFTLVKMLFSGLAVVAYTLLAEPANKLFVLPFFLIYGIYTSLEVYVMVRLARQTAPVKSE